jgi:hypothetical protein
MNEVLSEDACGEFPGRQLVVEIISESLFSALLYDLSKRSCVR